MLDPVLKRIDNDLEAAIERWSELLRIPSVSADPDYAEEVKNAAQWLSDELEGLGFSVEIQDTPGHPVVLAHHPGPDGDPPHLLYYGHYDVQPPDPVELWDTGPFEPTLVDGPHGRRMVCRGAVDDKGQLMMWLEALRAWKAEHGSLPIEATVVLEGEEEVGSVNLRGFLEANREALDADVCVVSDTTMLDVNTPAITYMLRGLLYTEITCHGPALDLHSGFYGGAIMNPLRALSGILGSLHDDRGRVQIPGFYDDVKEPGKEELATWQSLDVDEDAFLESVGVDAGDGEVDRSLLERLWSRPTGEINGVIGGYTGAGAKTVLPSVASAKVSFRLVPDQDPQKIIEGWQQFIDEHTPPGCRCELTVHSAAPAIRIPTESPWLNAARAALKQVFGRDTALIGCGGSIPVAAWVRDVLGFDTLFMGFGLEDDRMHSPNEKFEVVCFENGMRSHAALLAQFAEGRN